MNIALVGRMKVQGDGAENGVAGCLEDHGLLEVRETLAADSSRYMHAEQVRGLSPTAIIVSNPEVARKLASCFAPIKGGWNDMPGILTAAAGSRLCP